MSNLKNNTWLAAKLGVSLQTARTLHLRTDIPCLHIGPRMIRYDEAEIDAWTAQQRRPRGGK